MGPPARSVPRRRWARQLVRSRGADGPATRIPVARAPGFSVSDRHRGLTPRNASTRQRFNVSTRKPQAPARGMRPATSFGPAALMDPRPHSVPQRRWARHLIWPCGADGPATRIPVARASGFPAFAGPSPESADRNPPNHDGGVRNTYRPEIPHDRNHGPAGDCISLTLGVAADSICDAPSPARHFAATRPRKPRFSSLPGGTFSPCGCIMNVARSVAKRGPPAPACLHRKRCAVARPAARLGEIRHGLAVREVEVR
jgi:hypothetical protein